MLARLRAFFDERIGASGISRALLAAPITGGARWAFVLGAVLMWILLVELATGLALMTVYAPSAQTAWASVFYIQHHFSWGPLVRGLHYWGGQVVLVVLGLHILQVVLTGGYKRPREANWWLGLLLFALVFGFSHTGALLPWDQKAYWTTRVEGEITSTAPVVGPLAQRFIQGGREVGTMSITRLYMAHVGLLPLLTLALVAAHIALVRRHGHTPPVSVPPGHEAHDDSDAAVNAARARGVRVDRYWPAQAVRDAVAGVAIVLVLVFLAKKYGAPLEAPADPQSDYPARPEWYLLGLFKIRKVFEGPFEVIATGVIPGLLAGVMVALPLLDRSPDRALRRRIPAVAAALAVMLSVGGYTVWAWRKDETDAGFQRARQLVDRRAARAMALAAQGVPPEGPLEMVRNDPQVRPGELYEQHCAGCHAQAGAPLRNARGERSNARGPVLEGFGTREWARAVINDPEHTDLFGRTRMNEMGSQARRLGTEDGVTPEQGVTAVVEYLYAQGREPNDPPADAALVARGTTLFNTRCTGCHQGGPEEADVVDPPAPNLTGWASRAWIRDQITHPASPAKYGTRNEMPSFADELSARELEWVVDYVRGLRARPAPAIPVPAPRPAAPAEGAGEGGAATGDAGAGAGEGSDAAEPAPRAATRRSGRRRR